MILQSYQPKEQKFDVYIKFWDSQEIFFLLTRSHTYYFIAVERSVHLNNQQRLSSEVSDSVKMFRIFERT